MFDSPSSMRAAAQKYRLIASSLADQEMINFFTVVAADHDLKADLLEARQSGNGFVCLAGRSNDAVSARA